jgi:hypothetical protein
MKNQIAGILISALGFSGVPLAAQVQAGATFSGDGLSSFFVSIGSYYHVPEREVVVVHERSVPPEEVPVVFFVAQRARVAPAVVVDLRRHGLSWADIAFHFRLDPDIYYFNGGPPYGKAHGYWKKHPPRDVEVIDAVNVHFLSEFHGVTPDMVRDERRHGRSYVIVGNDFEARRHRRDGDDDRRHGHGRGHHDRD